MNSETKVYEEKMNGVIHHLTKELAAIRAGRANPAVLDKITVDYYGAPTPINQVAAIAVSEARIPVSYTHLQFVRMLQKNRSFHLQMELCWMTGAGLCRRLFMLLQMNQSALSRR